MRIYYSSNTFQMARMMIWVQVLCLHVPVSGLDQIKRDVAYFQNFFYKAKNNGILVHSWWHFWMYEFTID